ncbi:hypothetical protein Daus18300_000384 [Diaporthe australafricana]|uniref:Uncharacterized protein n=1 Tax=Diaporthe australafricana TaxID=127596 RepID=A0ABR3Y4V7_9PEZI
MEIVEDRLRDGLLTKEKVLERYTKQVCLDLDDDECPEALQNIKNSFTSLSDPSSSNLSQAKLKEFLSRALGTLGVDTSHEQAHIVTALAKILNWHSAYPFPIGYPDGENLSPAIDESAFIRAAALLTLEPRPFGAPILTEPPLPGTVGCSLPDAPGTSLDLVTERGKGAHDYCRWLFRSLAVARHQPPGPGSDDNDASPATARHLLPVPRLAVESQNDGDEAGKFWYVTMEDDRRTDVLDVLAETAPGCRRPLPRPLRASFERALPGLPRHALGLHELQVPADVLDALVSLLAARPRPVVRHGELRDKVSSLPGGEGSSTLQKKLGSLPGRLAARRGSGSGHAGVGLTWEEFDQELGSPDCILFIATQLDRVFGQFKKPISSA